MGEKFKSHKRLITYFFLALSLSYFLMVVFFLYREEQNRNVKLRELKNTENNMTITYSKVIAKEIGNIAADLKFLEQTFSYDLEDRLGVKNQWFLFCKNKNIYDQIRYIDKFGNEKIKVTYNYGSNESRCIDDYQLRNKYKEKYVRETFKLDKNQIYISELDLSSQDGKVEEPIKPIIRFSTPIFDRFGSLEGMIVLNYLGKNIIEEFKDIANFSNGQVYLLNKDGYFLYSDNKEEEWGFMYKDKRDVSFKEKFKDEWKLMEEGQNEILSDQGLFINYSINLEEIFKYDKKHVLRNREILSENDWIVSSFIYRHGIFRDAFKDTLLTRIKKITKENIFYFINLIFISIIISILTLVMQNSYLRTKFLSQHDSMTGTLNRRAGFYKLSKDIEMNYKGNHGICICFIDVDGLKQINDVLGHNSGDELIMTVVDVIKNTIRESDYIIRTGGDEFLIVFNNINQTQAECVWNRINMEFGNINIKENREYIVSVSHGLIEIDNKNHKSIEELVSQADEKMYIEKKAMGKKLKIIKDKVIEN